MSSILQNRLKQINELYIKQFKAIQKQYHQFKLAFQNINIQTKCLQNYIAKSHNLNLLHVAFTKNFINIIPKNCVIQVVTNMSSLLQDQTKKIKQLVIKEQQKRQRAFDGFNIVKTSNMCQKCGQNVRKINIQQIKASVEHQYLGLIQRMMKEINLQINDSLFTQEEDSQFFKKLHQLIKRKEQKVQSNISSIQELISLMQLEITKVVKFKQDYNNQSQQFNKPNEHLIKNIQESLTNLLNQSFKSKIPGFVNKMFKIYQKIYKKLVQKSNQQIYVQTQKWQSQQMKILNQKLVKINSLCFKQQNDINWLQNQLQEGKKHLLKKQKQWIESYQKLHSQNLSKQAQMKFLSTKIQQYQDQINLKQNKISQLKNKGKIKLRLQQKTNEKQIQHYLKGSLQKISNEIIQINQEQYAQNQKFNRQTKRKKTLKSKKVIQEKSTKKVRQNLSSINDLFAEQFYKNQDQVKQLQNNEKNNIQAESTQFMEKQYNEIQYKQNVAQQKKHMKNIQLQNKQLRKDQMKQSSSESSIESRQRYQRNNFRETLKSGKSQNYLEVAKVSYLLQEKVSKQKQNITIWKDSKQKRITKNQSKIFSQQAILSKVQLMDKNKDKTPRTSMRNDKIQQQLQKHNKKNQIFNNLKFDSQKRLIYRAKQQKDTRIQKNNIICDQKRNCKTKEVQTELFKQSILNLINIKKLAGWLKQKFNLKINNQDIQDQNFEQNLKKIIKEQYELNNVKSDHVKSHNKETNNDVSQQKNKQSLNIQKRILPLVCQGYKKKQTNVANSQQNMIKLKTKLEQRNTYYQFNTNLRNSQGISNSKNKTHYKKIKHHQYHKSQPTSTYQERFQQQPFQSQVCQFIKQCDISLFINQQTAYLYQCGHTKNYHKVGFLKLTPDQTSMFENVYHMLQQIKIYNILLYQELVSFIRYPYQTIKNNYSGIAMIKNMKIQSFISFIEKIMYLHKKCCIDITSKINICSHLTDFIQKVKKMLNQSMQAWATDSLQKQIQKQNNCKILKVQTTYKQDRPFCNVLKSQKSFKQLKHKAKSNNISRVKRFETQSKKKIY